MHHRPVSLVRLIVLLVAGVLVALPMVGGMGGCSKPGGEAARSDDFGVGAAATADLPIRAVAAGDFGYTNGWARSLSLPPGQRVRSLSVLGDLVVVVQEPINLVVGMSADTGKVRWVRRLGSPIERLMKPLRNQDRVYFASETNMYSLDVETGEDVEVGRLKYPVKLAPAQAGNLAIFGSVSGRLFAYSLRANAVIYSRHFSQQFLAPPIVSGDIVIAANQSGWARGYKAETGKLQWKDRTFGPFQAPPAADSARVYLASTDQFLYGLERSTGNELWKFPTEEPLLDSPVVLGRSVYQFVENRGLVSLAAESGEVQWELPIADEPIALTPDNRLLLLGKDRSTLTKIDPQTGATVERVNTQPLRDLLEGPDGSLMLLTQSGILHRLDPRK